MSNIDNMEAQIELMLRNIEKRGFKRVGGIFYSPNSLLPLENNAPHCVEPKKQFSRVRSILFVL